MARRHGAITLTEHEYNERKDICISCGNYIPTGLNQQLCPGCYRTNVEDVLTEKEVLRLRAIVRVCAALGRQYQGADDLADVKRFVDNVTPETILATSMRKIRETANAF